MNKTWDLFGTAVVFLCLVGGLAIGIGLNGIRPRPQTQPSFYERLDSLEASIDSLTVEVEGIRKYLEALTSEVAHEISTTNRHVESRALAELFVAEGLRVGVSPVLLARIARRESHFRIGALGALDDSGLLQVRTSIWYNFVVNRCGAWYRGDPRTEICAGAVVVRFYLDGCKGDVRCALSRYNTGRDSQVGRRYARAVIGD